MSRRSRAYRTKLAVRRLEDRTVPSTVQGTVFDDANRNQIFDPGESGLAGWTVYVDNNRDGIQNPGEVSAITGVAGDYLIDVTSVTPNGGRNYFSLDLQVGSGGRWLASTPTEVFAHPVNEPNAVRDFGVYFQPYAGVEPLGTETLLNVTTAGTQSEVSIDSDAAGNYVAAWKSSLSGIDTVFARLFDPVGSPLSGEITVASGAGLGALQVGMADNGRFAVGWSGNVPAFGKSSAFMRVYSPTGAPVAGPVTVAAATSSLHNFVSGVAMDADGDCAVLVSQFITSQRGNGTSYSYPLKVQRYSPTGATNGGMITVDDFQSGIMSGLGSIAMDDTGRFVVVWHDLTGTQPGVVAQRYSATGSKTGGLITVGVEPAPGRARLAAVSMNSTGQFAVTWDLWRSDNLDIHETKLSVYQPTGVPVRPTQTVATLDNPSDPSPSSIDDAGNVTVVWSEGDVHFRRVLADGTLEPELLVNTITQGPQDHPEIVATGTNQFVVAWQGYGAGDESGVFMQRFTNGPPPPPPTTFFSIDDISVVEGHSGTTIASFTVTLSAASTDTVTVQYLTANGTASSGSDFLSAGGTLVFLPGETSQSVSIPIIGDRLGEDDESFVVNLSNPVNAGIADGQGVGTIADDEPRVSVNDVSLTEGNSGTKNFVFTVTLSTAYDQNVAVSFRTLNGTASSNGGQADYVSQTGALTFLAGEKQKTISIAVKGDTKNESNETFSVELLNLSSNALFNDNLGLGTILNDD